METARDYSALLNGKQGGSTDIGPVLKEIDFMKQSIER